MPSSIETARRTVWIIGENYDQRAELPLSSDQAAEVTYEQGQLIAYDTLLYLIDSDPTILDRDYMDADVCADLRDEIVRRTGLSVEDAGALVLNWRPVG